MTFSIRENDRCFPCVVYKTDHPLRDPDSVIQISHPIRRIPTFKRHFVNRLDPPACLER